MARITLTDRFVGSDKRRPQKGRVDYPDALVPGMALRVTDTGHKSFVLIARYPLNPKNPTRRALGDHGVITLEEARNKARVWLGLISKGIDPKVQEAREAAKARRAQDATFAALWAAYYGQEACKLAKADEAARAGAAFVKAWGGRPASEIEPMEIGAHIRVIAKATPAEARNRFGHLSRAYSWAIGSGGFGLATNPCKSLRPKDLIGPKVIRERVLTDQELRAVWQAADGVADATALAEGRRRDGKRDRGAALGFPYGPLIRLMVLTGQREREIAEMTWSEVDFANRVWTIPLTRMKSDRPHVVPLADDALGLLQSLPRFGAGDFVFSTTDGAKPVNGFSRAKERLDALSGVEGWVLHDIRRTARTHFSALPVQDLVRELVIAHARPGLHRVYDQFSYVAEKAECLRLWEARLRGILTPRTPAGENVVQMVRQGVP